LWEGEKGVLRKKSIKENSPEEEREKRGEV